MWPRDHPEELVARKFLDLEERFPNSDKNSPAVLAGENRRFVMFKTAASGRRPAERVAARGGRRGVHPTAAPPERRIPRMSL